MRIVEIIGINIDNQGEELAPAPVSQSSRSVPNGNQVLWALLHNAFTPDGRLKHFWTIEPDLAAPTASGAGDASALSPAGDEADASPSETGEPEPTIPMI